MNRRLRFCRNGGDYFTLYDGVVNRDRGDITIGQLDGAGEDAVGLGGLGDAGAVGETWFVWEGR